MGMSLMIKNTFMDGIHYEHMKDDLSKFNERTIDNNGEVVNTIIYDPRFFENDTWGIGIFKGIAQFKEQIHKYCLSHKRTVNFNFPDHNLNLEMKFIAYHKIFTDEWSISNFIGNLKGDFSCVQRYLNENHPDLVSLLDLDLQELSTHWVEWLQKHGHATMATPNETLRNKVIKGAAYPHKSYLPLFLPNLCKWLMKFLDTREEWEKDGWDVRNLEKYGVSHNKTALSYYMYFNVINHPVLRSHTKLYIKQKLLSKAFAWNTARMYMSYIPMFFNFITELEPQWENMQYLNRSHILKYIEHLNMYIETNLTSRKANPEQYKNRAITCIHKFFSDLQLYKSEIAPIQDIRTLIFSEDKPKIPKKAYDKTDYIPDYVLEQLFRYIHDLHPDAVPVVWIMYKTGFRISDTLLLRQDCLVKINGKYWVETDIEKTYVKGHRIPIDDELAGVIAELIHVSKMNSNDYNNPEKFIFARLSGSRKGRPIGQYLIRSYLNILAHQKNIVDENGNRYHFTNHAFRHTYAVKMLNGGADIFTIQELMAHASPEMTMRYARLLDDNKRKAFDQAVAQGIFSFDGNSDLIEKDCSEIPKDTLNMLWMNHKLDAIDTPYGTCLQRTKGKCHFAKQPPCLTCNSGKPCKDLCVGVFDGDVEKYEILISSTESLIAQARRYDRNLTVRENQEILALYQNIYRTIIAGNLIYGRLERLVN